MATRNSGDVEHPLVISLDMVPAASSVTTTYYKLRAFDSSCATPTSVVWIDTQVSLTNAPPFPCSGPYVNLAVVAEWTVTTS